VAVESLHEPICNDRVEQLMELVVLDSDEQLVEIDQFSGTQRSLAVGLDHASTGHPYPQPMLLGEAVELLLELERHTRIIEKDKLQIDRLDSQREQLDDLHPVRRHRLDQTQSVQTVQRPRCLELGPTHLAGDRLHVPLPIYLLVNCVEFRRDRPLHVATPKNHRDRGDDRAELDPLVDSTCSLQD